MAVAVTLEVALLPQTVLEDVISDFAVAIAVWTVPLHPTLLLMISAKTSAVAVAVTGSHRAASMAAAAAVALPASRAVLAWVAAVAADVLALTLASCRQRWMATD